MPQPLISVLLVSWNSREDLAECLRSLQAQTDRDFETLVVDNGSRDGSVQMLREEFAWVLVVDARDNLGFAEGCNRGIDVARGTWIATLNCDAVVAPDWIERARKLLSEAPSKLGMVQCLIRFKQRPEHSNSTGVLLFKNGNVLDRDFDVPVRLDEELGEVFCPSAGAAFYRRTMLDSVRLATGYFDRQFFMYYEDVDLGWRCRLAGWEAWYAPELVVHHVFHGASRTRGNSFVVQHCVRNRVRYLLKNASLGLLGRAVPRTLQDMVRAVRLGGVSSLGGFARAARDGLALRSSVTNLCRVDRRTVEQRWVSSRG